jgi:hypothetical protein
VPTDQVNFHKTYVVSQKSRYSLKMRYSGGMSVSTVVYFQTKSILPDGALVHFETESMDLGGLPNPPELPTFDSHVGPTGMPNSGDIKGPSEFIVFIAAAGMVPDKMVSVGDKFSVHWQNDSKTVLFESDGLLESIDKAAGTAKVSWTITMTPSYTTGGIFHLKSVYNLADFSLASSEGDFALGSNKIGLEVTRVKDKD